MAKRKRRTFTPEFKTEVVLEALTRESSQAELCRRHNLSEDQLSKWKQQFLENAVSVFTRSVTAQRVSRDTSFRSRRAVSFKYVYLNVDAAWR